MARAPALQEIEAPPEFERIEGLPHPRETACLVGHERQEEMLAAMLAGGRMHHAWLLAGPAGVGKATFAYRLARYVLASAAERGGEGGALAVHDTSTTARLVHGLAHPGLLIVRRPWDPRGKRFPVSIPVDEVRRLRAFLGRTAEEGAWRVVIVDSADELNVNAANALLKLLEEPPRQTLFLLVTREPGRLLPTIRSRCRVLQLEPLASDQLKVAVDSALAAGGQSGIAPAVWERMEPLSHGSVRRALEMSMLDGLKLYDRLEALFNTLPDVDWPAAHALADEIASAAAEQRLELWFDLLLSLISRLVRAAGSGQGSPADLALARRLVPPPRLASWAELWETIVRDKAETLALNLDRKLLVLETVGRLEQAARG